MREIGVIVMFENLSISLLVYRWRFLLCLGLLLCLFCWRRAIQVASITLWLLHAHAVVVSLHSWFVNDLWLLEHFHHAKGSAHEHTVDERKGGQFFDWLLTRLHQVLQEAELAYDYRC